MDLSIITPPDPGALPVAAFRAQLRLGTGFADETSQDGELAGFLTAAIAAIEARTGKALLSRGLRLGLEAWRWPDAQALPVAPVTAITELVLRDASGAATTVDPARYRLKPDGHRPQIVARGLVLPPIPPGGRAEIAFTAGFGPAWADLPADLAQAVLLLAAGQYQARTGLPGPSPAVAALLAPWQPVRVGGAR